MQIRCLLVLGWCFSVCLFSGGGPSFILARHLQHRAEDGGEREETGHGPWLPPEDRVRTPRNLPRRAGMEWDGGGRVMGGWKERIESKEGGGGGESGGADPSRLREEQQSHDVTRGDGDNVAGSCWVVKHSFNFLLSFFRLAHTLRHLGFTFLFTLGKSKKRCTASSHEKSSTVRVRREELLGCVCVDTKSQELGIWTWKHFITLLCQLRPEQVFRLKIALH